MHLKKKFCLLPVLLSLILTGQLPAQDAAAQEANAESAIGAASDAKSGRKEKERVASVLSFDLGWLLHGFSRNGIALGVNYERLIVPHFSLRGTMGFMLFNASALDAYAVDVSISLYASWYPLSRMLDRLYVSVGSSADFVCYFGNDSLPDPANEVLVTVTPIVGWKQNIANIVVLDFYGGYSFVVLNSQLFHGTDEYIRSGIQLGVRVKLLWRPKKGK